MYSSHLNLFGRLTLALLAAAALALPVRAEIGFLVTGVGPVNRSMGGASVAAPLDATGALYWNPASISGLQQTEVEFGLELIYPQTTLSSSVPSGAIIPPFFPPQSMAGSTRSDSGVTPLPAMGLVYRPDDSSWTFGLGIYGVGGFSVNYPASLTNPILTAQPPLGIGLGAITSQLQIFQIAPTASYRLTDTLSVGFAATTDLAYLVADPAVIATPDDSLHTGFPIYPTGTHTRTTWGLGFQGGLYYSPGAGWNFGASVKSPQWFEPFRFNAQDELGRPRSFKFHFDMPMIVSVGVGYTGFARWVLAADFRYVDFKNTAGLREGGFDSLGAVRGLGWNNAFAMSLGAQYRVTDALSVRLGYSFNTNPIPDSQSSFNVASATIIEHSLAVGLSYQLMNSLILSLAYAHDFDNSITGPIISPAGTIPGSSVTSEVAADAILLGAQFRY